MQIGTQANNEARLLEPVLTGFQELAEELGMDDEIRNDLLRSFLDRCREFLNLLSDSISNRDQEKFERTTHSLKGLSGNMRFHKLGDLNEQFTQAYHDDDLQKAGQVLSDMGEEYHRIQDAITDLIGK